MMPIVFCASFVPCASATSELVAIWLSRKPGRSRPLRHVSASGRGDRVSEERDAPQMKGAEQRRDDDLGEDPVQITAPIPTAAIIAPSTPPISACEEDDGMLKYHVTRFQRIAPISPAKTIGDRRPSCSTIPLAIVAATVIEMNAPTKFSTAASTTAIRGLSARVAIVVAMAFAVS